jgi:acyl-[acyl-carrier protein] desaturase
MSTLSPTFREERAPVQISAWEEEYGWRVEEMFWSYFNRSEDPEGWNRRWVIERDVPWADVRREPLHDDTALMIESFFAVESYLPDFAEKGLNYYRAMVGLSNTHINWSYEELKHGRTLQLLLQRSGLRTPEQMREFRLGLARNAWTLPYPTPRQMLIYAAFQEKETQRNYEHLRGVLAGHGSFGAAHGLRIIARDEAFHHAFYKDLVRMLLEYDEVGTARDIQQVATTFRMPAQHLLPDMEQRVRVMVRNKVFGKRQVRDEAIIPTVRAFGFRDLDELASVASACAVSSNAGDPIPCAEGSPANR